jgi:hypothetical protein
MGKIRTMCINIKHLLSLLAEDKINIIEYYEKIGKYCVSSKKYNTAKFLGELYAIKFSSKNNIKFIGLYKSEYIKAQDYEIQKLAVAKNPYNIQYFNGPYHQNIWRMAIRNSISGIFTVYKKIGDVFDKAFISYAKEINKNRSMVNFMNIYFNKDRKTLDLDDYNILNKDNLDIIIKNFGNKLCAIIIGIEYYFGKVVKDESSNLDKIIKVIKTFGDNSDIIFKIFDKEIFDIIFSIFNIYTYRIIEFFSNDVNTFVKFYDNDKLKEETFQKESISANCEMLGLLLSRKIHVPNTVLLYVLGKNHDSIKYYCDHKISVRFEGHDTLETFVLKRKLDQILNKFDHHVITEYGYKHNRIDNYSIGVFMLIMGINIIDYKNTFYKKLINFKNKYLKHMNNKDVENLYDDYIELKIKEKY